MAKILDINSSPPYVRQVLFILQSIITPLLSGHHTRRTLGFDICLWQKMEVTLGLTNGRNCTNQQQLPFSAKPWASWSQYTTEHQLETRSQQCREFILDELKLCSFWNISIATQRDVFQRRWWHLLPSNLAMEKRWLGFWTYRLTYWENSKDTPPSRTEINVTRP